MAISYRQAQAIDGPQLADMRWELHTSGQEKSPQTRDDFCAYYQEYLLSTLENPTVLHWVAADGNTLAATATLILVPMPPKPAEGAFCWGYLTNCYTLPAYRKRGIGAELLEKVKNWAKERNLELLVVWPSIDAYGFYERAGFRRQADPLTLPLSKEAT